LEYNLHTVLFFEHLSINLRELLAKFGKNVGINLAAVRSYAQQLFLALQHLQSHGIIHADIKLDNILVSHCFQHVKLCDFGSAFLEADPLEKEILTPYLVSRFYRAPEIILGLDYDPAIDVWSLAVTLVEVFTGQVLFAGRTNNDMLSKFMESLGPFSHRMMKRHIMSYSTKFNRVPHFEEMSSGGTYAFRKQDVDDVTGRPVIRIVPVAEGAHVAHDQSLAQILLRAKSKSDSRVDVLQLADFLHRCLALDPTKRLKVDAALKHDLFVKKKTTTTTNIA
jgi:serine/threonine-protein kinase PRP4